MAKERKTDRRTIYTVNAIKDALLFSESASGTVIDLVDIIKSGKFELFGTNDMILPACQRIW